MKLIRRFAFAAFGVFGIAVLVAQTASPPPATAQAAAVAPTAAKAPTAHPLDPLTEDEITAAIDLLKAEGKSTHYLVYSFIGLQEPAKDAVLAFKEGDPIVRRVKLVCYDTKNNATIEGVVNVTTNKVESWAPIPGAQAPATSGIDQRFTERIVRTDARWQAAIKRRNLDPVEIEIGPAPARGYLDKLDDGSRYVVALSYRDDPSENGEIPGLVVLVNLTKRTVEWVHDDPAPAPMASVDNFFDPDRLGKPREAPKPLTITQPEGQSFQINGSEVRWQKWRFRIGQDPRVGLVLYTVGYEDEGKVRSIMYRGSLSEVYVPYGDPNWFLVHWFDAGEFGMASQWQSSMKPLNDVPGNATLLPVTMFRPNGTPRTIENAVAVYERDGGILWRHGGDSRRARELVLGSIYRVGNYDYSLNWVFHQDGTLEGQVEATGFMETRNVERTTDADPSHPMAMGAGSVGTLVAPNVTAPNHQHFFSFRLDMDVDGVKNEVHEMNVEPVPAGDGNKSGNGFAVKDTLLKTEKAAERSLNAQTARCWAVVNPAVKNALGQPSSYVLMPGDNAVPYSLPGSYLSGVGAFVQHHLWATPYAANEMYGAGTYVRDGRPTDGLVKWTAGDRSIDNEDVVLWYTVGITHIPRVEEWPIMNTHRAGFMLVPTGFFSKNPALDVPETKAPKAPVASGGSQ
jgi:primary-amine oxidase